MANSVVIGDLSLAHGDDCLKFSQGYLVIPQENYLTSESFTFTGMMIDDPSNTYLLDTRDNGGNAIVFINGVSNLWQIYNCELYIDSVLVNHDAPVIFETLSNFEVVFLSPQIVTKILARQGDSSKFTGTVCNLVTKNGTYIQNGDYGDATLIDHSGNGNDGTINGATWWKKGVDQVFATPDLYKATLVSPLPEKQVATYTDGTPFYSSEDVFWNPYNQDVTHDFTVKKLASTIGIVEASILRRNLRRYR